jgi:hypothetical protein
VENGCSCLSGEGGFASASVYIFNAGIDKIGTKRQHVRGPALDDFRIQGRAFFADEVHALMKDK